MSQTLTIAAGAYGNAAGDIRDIITLGANATLDISASTHVSMFGGVAAIAPAALVIEAGATVFAPGPVAPAVTVVMRGAGSVLQLDGTTLAGFSATVASLVPGSVIDISGSRITSVTRRGLLAGRYGLLVYSDSGLVGTIAIGSGLPATILAVPDGLDGTRLITGPYLAPPVTLIRQALSDSGRFIWVGGASGNWATAGNWVTSSGAATRAPGAADAVVLNSSTLRVLPVAGSGLAASVATSGVVAWAAPPSAGSLLAGTSGSDALVLTANAYVTASSATIRQGALSIQGGTFVVTGALTVSGLLDGTNASSISVGSLVVDGGAVRLATNSAMSVGASASWTPGALAVTADGSVLATGTIEANVVLAGTIEVHSTLSIFGALTGRGLIRLDAGSTLFAAGGLDHATIDFAPSATLELFGNLSGAVLSSFGAGNCLQLAGSSVGALTWTASIQGGTLDLGLLGSIAIALNAAIDPGVVTFQSAPDGLGGSAITMVPCFLTQTRLRTPNGWIQAGKVQPRCWLATASGSARRATWIGATTVPAWLRAASPQLDPVRIHREALGRGRPVTDLLVSPLHGVVVDTIDGKRVVPAVALYDSIRVTRDRMAGRLDYVHIALTSHDVLLAEDLPCESYRPHAGDSRDEFRQSVGKRPLRMHPIAPRLEQGYELEMLRSRLSFRREPHSTDGLEGNLELSDEGLILGWAVGSHEIDILLDGIIAGRAVCNQWRADLEAAGKNNGFAAFVARHSAGPPQSRVSLRRPLSNQLSSTDTASASGVTREFPYSAGPASRSTNLPRFS